MKRTKKISILIIGLFVICTMMNSCVSRKKTQFFQGIDQIEGSSIYDQDNVEIKPGDKLLIKVISTNQEAAVPFNPVPTQGGGGSQQVDYIVSDDGMVNFPVVGNVKLEGNTIIQAADILKEKIEVYLNDPIVQVRISNFNIYFVGAVQNTVVVQNDYINLFQAISQSGLGIMNSGRLDNVLVIREEDGVRRHKYLDLRNSEIVNSPFYHLQQNDIIYVEPTAVARQSRSYLSTVSSYLGIVASVLSLIVIFNR